MTSPRKACIGLLAALVFSALSTASARGQKEAPQGASAAEIANWILQLDSPEYKTRETATRHLVDAGAAAIEPLHAEANSDRVEASERAVWVLWQYAESKDLDVAVAALERLISLNNRNTVVAKAADKLSLIRHQRAVVAIKELGGLVGPLKSPFFDPRLSPIQVVIDSHWKGGDQGLSLLTDIRDLRRVSILGTDLTADGVAKLGGVRADLRISLYGTRITNDKITELRKQLPNATFDIRRGGLLGIHGDQTIKGFAQVMSVQPEGAAAKAGMLAGDRITHLNGRELADFQALIDQVAELAPGDEVTLRINRFDETFEIKVRLGEWNAKDVMDN